MRSRRYDTKIEARLVTAFLMLVFAMTAAQAQLGERAQDPTGFSIRVRRVQVVHSESENIPGTSMHLQRRDPWLAYKMGHDYFEREWNKDDGYLSFPVDRPLTGAVNSCAMCHNLPFRTAGSGGNVAEPTGFGQNTPHLFGIGLIETIAIQIRQQILNSFDLNHNGFLDVPAETRGRRAIVEAMPGTKVDFGTLEDLNGDGWPGLNDVVKVILVDSRGRPVPPKADGKPARLGDAGVAGYDLAVGFLSSTQSDHQFASLRLFIIGVMQTVFGLPVQDSTVTNDKHEGRGEGFGSIWATTSNAGAKQLYFPLPNQVCAGPCLPVSGGELDLVEWYLLNHPAPAVLRQNEQTLRGRRLMDSFGCTTCHVADWGIHAADDKTGFTGDRRFFDLEVSATSDGGKLTGALKSLTASKILPNGITQSVPLRGKFIVKNVFTDLRHHDVGQRFFQYSSSNGQMFFNRSFRTPPLWGVGSTAPYGHDGRSPTIDDVIRRHGGSGEKSAAAYTSAPSRDRAALVAFLESLSLYVPDDLPADIDGDGLIEANFRRQGLELGPERLWPELLFTVVPRYRGWVNLSDGRRYFSYSLFNAPEVYGRNLPALIDADGNGVPDNGESSR